MARLPTPLALALAVLVLVLLCGPPSTEAGRAGRGLRGAAAADHLLLSAMHLRDRGRLEDALSVVRKLLTEHPLHFSAHRLYMELAGVARRNGGLGEAEYRHFLAQDPKTVSASPCTRPRC